MLETYLKLLELCFFELKIAFEELADHQVWVRPAPTLLSIGETAGHLAYADAMRMAGTGTTPPTSILTSPLIDPRFRYYPVTLRSEPTPEQLAMGAQQVCDELVRVHEESLREFHRRSPELDARIPGCPSGFTHREYLEYAIFHFAYHTGQIYSARHLLGAVPPDN